MKVDISPNEMASHAARSEARVHIRKVILSNFKKFESLRLDFDPDLNVFAGDNEAGKSSILSAVDLALSASRSKVETIGVESLMRKSAVEAFLAGTKKFEDLPSLVVEVYLSDGRGYDLHGRCNWSSGATNCASTSMKRRLISP